MRPNYLFLLFILIASCGSKDTTSNSGENTLTPVVFGDSIAYGTGTSSEQYNLSACLSRKSGQQFINKGIPGDTSRGAIAQLQSILDLKPKLVVLSIGGNDLSVDLNAKANSSFIKGAFPATETLANIHTLFRAFQENNISVIYINMTPPLTLKKLATIPATLDGRLTEVINIAKQYPNVKVVENAMENLWLNKELMTDNIHPNDKGYALMCERIFNKMNE